LEQLRVQAASPGLTNVALTNLQLSSSPHGGSGSGIGISTGSGHSTPLQSPLPSPAPFPSFVLPSAPQSHADMELWAKGKHGNLDLSSFPSLNRNVSSLLFDISGTEETSKYLARLIRQCELSKKHEIRLKQQLQSKDAQYELALRTLAEYEESTKSLRTEVSMLQQAKDEADRMNEEGGRGQSSEVNELHVQIRKFMQQVP
jgi:hypothetical protein